MFGFVEYSTLKVQENKDPRSEMLDHLRVW